jgi:hypothetical protein
MVELCLTLVLVLDSKAPDAPAVAAATSARPCTRVLRLTDEPEADRALVGSVPRQARLIAYGPAAAAAAVARWPDREMTIGGVGPATAPLFEADHRRVLALSPGGAAALRLAVRLLPKRATWCTPTASDMAMDRLDRARFSLAQDGISLLAYTGATPRGCQGLVAWFEGPAATSNGFSKLARVSEQLELPLLGFSPGLLGKGADLAVGVGLLGYFSRLLDGGDRSDEWLLWVDPSAAARKRLAWPSTWPSLPLRLKPRVRRNR